MKIVFMGTPEFAVGTLEALVKHHEVLAVFTQPDRPSGRGNKLAPPPVKIVAEKYNIPVYQPERIKKGDWAEQIRAMAPDVIVVIAYGQLLSEALLNSGKYGSINVHASLLPKYRGAAPINWAIVNGESETGITTMQMDVGLDTGDMLMKVTVPITAETTAGTLHDVLAEAGATLLIETLSQLEKGTLTPVAQDNDQTCYAPMIKRETALIDWQKSGFEIDCMIRGFNPWPVCYTYYKGERMKIFKGLPLASIDAQEKSEGTVGEIIGVDADGFTIKCGKGYLKVLEIQYGNKKRMPVKAFLLGHDIALGEVLKEA